MERRVTSGQWKRCGRGVYFVDDRTVHRRGAHPSSRLGIWGASSRERNDGGVVARPDTVRARGGRRDNATQQPWPAPPGTRVRRRDLEPVDVVVINDMRVDRPRADRCRSFGEARWWGQVDGQRPAAPYRYQQPLARAPAQQGSHRRATVTAAAAGSRWGSAIRGGKAAPPNPAAREHHRLEGQLSRRRLPRRRRLPGSEGRRSRSTGSRSTAGRRVSDRSRTSERNRLLGWQVLRFTWLDLTEYRRGSRRSFRCDFGAVIHRQRRQSAPDSRKVTLQNKPMCLDRRQIRLYSQVINVMAHTRRWTAVTAQLTQIEIDQWRDKKRYLWLMGLIAPTALFVMLPLVWAFNQCGLARAAQVPFWIGPILLYVLLPALDLRFGPDGQNPPDEVMERLENDKYYRYCTYIYIPFQYASVDLRRVPVHRVRPELAGLRRRPGLAGQDRPGAVGGGARRGRHQHRPRDGSQEGLAGALAVEDHAGADLLRPLLHRAQPRPSRPRRHPGGSRVGPLRRDVLGVPAAQRVRQPEVGMGARGQAAASGPARARGTGPTTCSTHGRCRWCSTAR